MKWPFGIVDQRPELLEIVPGRGVLLCAVLYGVGEFDQRAGFGGFQEQGFILSDASDSTGSQKTT